jgi:hypothetical protein
MLTRRNYHRWCLALNHLPDRAIIWVLTGLACANEIPEFGIVTQGAEVVVEVPGDPVRGTAPLPRGRDEQATGHYDRPTTHAPMPP